MKTKHVKHPYLLSGYFRLTRTLCARQGHEQEADKPLSV
ncbi:hypothetical protein C1A50_4280 [Paenibacillus polymyxa]|nr:hypothetical protein C1A50_4280 [Paenibacillus polymyxa]